MDIFWTRGKSAPVLVVKNRPFLLERISYIFDHIAFRFFNPLPWFLSKFSVGNDNPVISINIQFYKSRVHSYLLLSLRLQAIFRATFYYKQENPAIALHHFLAGFLPAWVRPAFTIFHSCRIRPTYLTFFDGRAVILIFLSIFKTLKATIGLYFATGLMDSK